MPEKHASFPDEDYLTVGQAARVLGVSGDTIRRYADSGRLSCHRLPTGARRFKRSDLEAAKTPACAP